MAAVVGWSPMIRFGMLGWERFRDETRRLLLVVVAWEGGFTARQQRSGFSPLLRCVVLLLIEAKS
jgi:hypothetical protein